MDFLATFIFWLIPATIYLGPSILAVCRRHYHASYIVVFNLLFGWTVLGLFVGFAWALSATRRSAEESADTMPTDFGERLFHNRNIIRQPDGGATVYPGLLTEEAYWLGAADFATFLKMRREETRRNFPRGLIMLIAAGGSFLGFRQWIGAEHGTAPALVMFCALAGFIAAWDLVLRPRREFLATFPKAPRAKDPIRKQRKVLAGLVAFDPVICFGATLLCTGLIASLTTSLLAGAKTVTVSTQDGAILLLGFAFLAVGGAVYGQLTWHHIRFWARHRRAPSQDDIDALGTGVKPAKVTRNHRQAANGSRTAPQAGPSDQGLASALGLGLRES